MFGMTLPAMEAKKANETKFIIITYGYGVQEDYCSQHIGHRSWSRPGSRKVINDQSSKEKAQIQSADYAD